MTNFIPQYPALDNSLNGLDYQWQLDGSRSVAVKTTATRLSFQQSAARKPGQRNEMRHASMGLQLNWLLSGADFLLVGNFNPAFVRVLVIASLALAVEKTRDGGWSLNGEQRLVEQR